tara:strand:+ start:438 stop:674 length:237 start_codon:yes stop_codon:yes gene_type:complete
MTQTYPMEFTMKVNMDNAAFREVWTGFDKPDRKELQRILQNVESDVFILDSGACTDYNGNTVGSWEITESNLNEEEEE